MAEHGGMGLRLGIDLGTGSLKLAAWHGNRVFSASASYPIISISAGAAETDPEEWVRALRDAWASVRADLLAARIEPWIESIGIDGQMHGFVPLSTTGTALHPAIIWADTRGARYASEARERLSGLGDRLLNAPAAGLTAPILLWLQRERPEVYARISTILFPKDYLRFRITGALGTDRGDASASLLYDFGTGRWSPEALAALGLDSAILPEIHDSFAQAGRVTAACAAETGLPEGVPVAVGSADTACALYGSGLFSGIFAGTSAGSDWRRPSVAQLSVGTGVQVIVPVRGLPAYDPALNFFASCVEGVGYRMAAMLNGGIALEWVIKALGASWDTFYADFDAGRIDLPKDLLFLPYLAGERSPYMNPSARGAWIGIGLHHGREDLLAAALLGVAGTVRLGMESLGVHAGTTVYVVGGSSRYPGWMRILSGMLGRPLSVCSVSDVAVRGSAVLGASSAAVGRFVAEDLLPAPGVTTSEAPFFPWAETWYARFRSCYLALYGERGAYFTAAAS